MASASAPPVSATGRQLPRNWLSIVVVIWIGQAFSIVTSFAAAYAAVWYITETTGSARWLSIAALVSVLPTGLLSPFGGVLADRFNRRSIMLIADATVGVASGVLGLIIWLSQPSLGVILVILAARAAAQAFHTPALTAAMPMLVPARHLLRANSASQMLWSAAGIGAPALGILFYQAIGFHWVMLLDAAGAAFACLGLAFVSIPTVRDRAMDGRRMLANLADGFRAIRSHRGLYHLMLVSVAIMVVFTPVGSLFPLIVYGHFGGSGYMAALTETAWGGAMLTGSLLLLAWGGGRRLVVLVIASGVGIGLTIAACGALPASGFPAFIALTAVMGFVAAFYNSPLTTLTQRHVPEAKLGRAMGLFHAAISLATPVGLAIAGIVAERTGIARWFLISGLVVTALSVLPLAMSSVRALDRATAPGSVGEVPAADADHAA
ncbi:MAG: MFS transporter [Bifidobacteriaceae bacterium]|jgi:DHA3 family macrolide efflux protein-like MFS transporter|nr:MFS transporter [Bifidobacteriaceae bacterium]